MLAAIGAGWVLTRPLTLTLAATPADATIRFAAVSQEATGTLTAEDLRPGTYTIEVGRSGFATQTVDVEVERFGSNRFDVALEALPWDVSVTTKPEGATCTITRDGTELLAGPSALAGQVTAGPAVLRVTHDGFNVVERELFIEEPTSIEVWLDPEGQVLRGVRTITTLGAPKGVSVTPDGSEAWTSILNGPPSIEIFDPRTGAKVGEVDIGTHGAVEVIFNKSGTLAYTSQMETARCFEIDVATRKVVREFDTESAWTKWVSLSPDEKTLYASNWSGDDVSEIDLSTGELVRRVRVSNTPRGMYATADGKSLYVAGFDSGDLERIDLATGEVTALYTDGGALRHIVGDEKHRTPLHLGHGEERRARTRHRSRDHEEVRRHRREAQHHRSHPRRQAALRELPGGEQPEVLLHPRARVGLHTRLRYHQRQGTRCRDRGEPAHCARRLRRRKAARLQRLPRQPPAGLRDPTVRGVRHRDGGRFEARLAEIRK
jgi:hypothetical protein